MMHSPHIARPLSSPDPVASAVLKNPAQERPVVDPFYVNPLGIYGHPSPGGYMWLHYEGQSEQHIKADLAARGVRVRRDDVEMAFKDAPAPVNSAGICSISFPCVQGNGDPWNPKIVQVSAIMLAGNLITISRGSAEAIDRVDEERRGQRLSPSPSDPGYYPNCNEWKHPADLAVRLVGGCIHRVESLVDRVCEQGSLALEALKNRPDHEALEGINDLQAKMRRFEKAAFDQLTQTLSTLSDYGCGTPARIASSKIASYCSIMQSSKRKFEDLAQKVADHEDALEGRISNRVASQGFELNALLAAFVPLSIGLSVGGINMAEAWSTKDVLTIVGASLAVSGILLTPYRRELGRHLHRILRSLWPWGAADRSAR